MRKTLILTALIMASTSAISAKKKAKTIQDTDTTAISLMEYTDVYKNFAGAQYTYNTSTNQHWRGFNSFFDRSHATVTVNIYTSLSFSSDYNLVTLRVEKVPVCTSAPDNAALGDIYTKTFRYEVKDNQLIIDKFVFYNISPDYKILTSAKNAGDGFPFRFVRR